MMMVPTMVEPKSHETKVYHSPQPAIYNESSWCCSLLLDLKGDHAVPQSLVHDKAFIDLHSVSGPFSQLYCDFDASNHILYSLLCRLSAWGLGNSGWRSNSARLCSAGWLMT